MIQRFEVGHRLSEMAIYNGVAYLAGQVPLDDNADAYTQTKQTLAEVDKWLAKASTDKSRILMATVYLADMADYAEMNQAWDEWVAENNAPPRAAVEAKLANPNWKVEIVVTAAV
ncbi:RidA family protein [Mannheimia sp. AT1]|uniref:RidA family protein n=1 Tax=Mannheimia cairinae TaxID=3025936 RepID=A0ABT5MNE2_9PAST|nr:RidA family protein [Mannheimia cairinae]MDD0823513.1 RidA family protein [Mannheimia cairinae]MDD0826726.1 RidA family protein [Mannheimia cairinae]